jgi:hypothetical protein
MPFGFFFGFFRFDFLAEFFVFSVFDFAAFAGFGAFGFAFVRFFFIFGFFGLAFGFEDQAGARGRGAQAERVRGSGGGE